MVARYWTIHALRELQLLHRCKRKTLRLHLALASTAATYGSRPGAYFTIFLSVSERLNACDRIWRAGRGRAELDSHGCNAASAKMSASIVACWRKLVPGHILLNTGCRENARCYRSLYVCWSH